MVLHISSVAPDANFDSGAGYAVGDTIMVPNFRYTCISAASGQAIWSPNRVVNSRRILGYSVDPSTTLSTTTGEIQFSSVLVPANAMETKGRLQITTTWSNNNSANIKTPRVRFGPNNLTGTAFMALGVTTSIYISDFRQIMNTAANVQKGSLGVGTASGFGVSAGAPPAGAVDTTADAYVVFSGQLANGADLLSLQSYLVELILPPS